MSRKPHSAPHRWRMTGIVLLILSVQVGLTVPGTSLTDSINSALNWPTSHQLSNRSYGTKTVPGTSLTDSINSALTWLTSHQLSDGSYGTCSEPETAPAAYAVWIARRDSTNVVSALNWLKNQMNNSTTWFWVGGGCSLAEADVPGEILYVFDVTGHLSMLNLSFVSSKLLGLQQANGGFKGYSTSTGQQVTSSVDTAMALWGLINAGAIPASSEQSGINYLLSLQNPGGSFNLTSTIASDPLYSLGPEPISITALVTLVLKSASFPTTNPHVASALSYLTNAASMNFTGHVYAAALSSLVFASSCLPSSVSATTSFIISQQNSDGGFRDIIRFSSGSNALDTGWAATALQLTTPICASGGIGGGRGHYQM